MIYGFTGTSEGMTKTQRAAFRALVIGLPRFEVFHHGDCVGADAQAHNTVRKRTDARIIVHPPANDKARAFCKGASFTYESDEYLVRNRNIVNRCQHLIATPKGPEVLRSGTWSTVRYAKKIDRPLTIIYPDGEIQRVAGNNLNPCHELRSYRGDSS
jgi:hypothetical protein